MKLFNLGMYVGIFKEQNFVSISDKTGRNVSKKFWNVYDLKYLFGCFR